VAGGHESYSLRSTLPRYWLATR